MKNPITLLLVLIFTASSFLEAQKPDQYRYQGSYELPGNTSGQNNKLVFPFDVDPGSYLLKHDIVYQTPAYEGFEGFPLGNGDLGGMVWCTPRGLKIQINKSDTYDRPNEETRMVLRSCGQLDIDFGAPGFDWIHLKDFEGRLSLYDAAARLIEQHPDYRNAITPDPIVAARLGMGEESLKMITNSIRRLQHFPQGLFYNIDHWPVAFKLHTEGAFIISALRNEDGAIPSLGIESRAGNVCRLVNPWPGQKPEVREVSGTGKRVRYRETDDGVIVFKTIKNGSYLVGIEGFERISKERPLFTGERNIAPKHFHEAILGKKRNF